MLVYLADLIAQYYSGFHVFSYVTFRAILGLLTALAFSLWFGPKAIRYLQVMQIGQVVRQDGPESHLDKSGTPTMGGVMILISIVVGVGCWCDLQNRYVLINMFVLLSFGLIGFMDDYYKVIRKNSDGLIARWKYFWQSVVAFIVAFYLFNSAQSPDETRLIVPFFKDFMPQLGWWFVVLAYLTIVGSSNAVNLTDGLDGLAIFPTVMVAAALAVIAYLSGHIEFANYLHIPYLPGLEELVIVCAVMVGAGLGFLWFNTYPAMVFMGDVGSLALGATLGSIAVSVRQEVLLVIMGGVFVIETLSVILQVGSYKLRGGRRVFLMAPIHHHFELKGWPEPRVIVRFWIVSLFLVLLGLSTLKLR